MEAGKLRKRIVIEAPIAHRDEDGQNVPIWTPQADVWCSVKQLSGRQIAMAGAKTITATATHEIRMRYRADLTLQIGYHRLRIEGVKSRAFALNQIVNVDERNTELVLTCTEVKS